MDKAESKTTSFHCAVVGRMVTIFRDYKIRVNRQGEEVARIVAGTKCGDMDKCAIATHTGNATSYDWAKCVFLKPVSEQA